MLAKKKAQSVARSDAEIAREVKRRMKADFDVPDDWLAVTVAEGIVTIEGTVVRYSHSEAAENCASKVRGVRGIVNKIAVEPLSVEA
jgi:osmotically-inducible protein OsmY